MRERCLIRRLGGRQSVSGCEPCGRSRRDAGRCRLRGRSCLSSRCPRERTWRQTGQADSTAGAGGARRRNSMKGGGRLGQLSILWKSVDRNRTQDPVGESTGLLFPIVACSGKAGRPPPALRDRHHNDRHRRREAERARTGDDEHCQSRNEAEREPRFRTERRPGYEGDLAIRSLCPVAEQCPPRSQRGLMPSGPRAE